MRPLMMIPQTKRKILMIRAPKTLPALSLAYMDVLHSKDLSDALGIISDERPDLVIYFAREQHDDLEEHVMTWLIEGFRGKFVVLDPANRIKDFEILLDSQVVDEYYSGPLSPERFLSIVKSQLTQDMRFASPRAMTTFDLFRNLFDRGLNAIFFFLEDLQRCVAANLRAEQILGHSLSELRKISLGDFIHEDHAPKTLRTIRRASRQYYDARGVTVIKDRLNRSRAVSFSCGVFNFGRKSFVKIEIQDQPGQDIFRAKQETVVDEQELSNFMLDPKSFMRAVESNLSQNNRKKNLLSLVLCRVKPGKAIGDLKDPMSVETELMKKFATMLQSKIRETDLLSQISRDQFAILLPKGTQESANNLVKRLTTALEKVPTIKNQFYAFEIEMAQCPSQAYPFMQLLHSAEMERASLVS